MTEQAKLAYLSQPAPGRFLLNLQTEGQEGVTVYEVSKDHVRGLVADGAAMAFRARDDSAHQSARASVEKSGITRQASPEERK